MTITMERPGTQVLNDQIIATDLNFAAKAAIKQCAMAVAESTTPMSGLP